MKTTDYCRCGTQLIMSAPDSDQPAIQAARRVFLAGHHGLGHGPCDLKTAAVARLAYRPNRGRRVPPAPAAE